MSLISPHGGQLTPRLAAPAPLPPPLPPASHPPPLVPEASNLPRLTLTPKQSCDLEMMAIGAFSPLTGFMGSADFGSVCHGMQLASGTLWPIPILLSVNKAQ